MKMKHLEEDLYDYVTNRMDEGRRQDAEKHVKICTECQKEIDELKKTINLLNQFQPPPLSEEFKESVKQKLRALQIPLPPKSLFQRLKESFQIRPLIWVLEGVAVMAVIMLSVGIFYKSYNPYKSHLETITKDLQIELAEVKNPIIIEAGDLDNTLESLKELIRIHEGKVLQVLQLDKGLKITFSLEKEQESVLFDNLKQLGNLWMKEEGYKDGQGNIVILLIKKN